MTHGLHCKSVLVSRHRGLLLISTVVIFVALHCTVASATNKKINVTVGQSVTHKLGAEMGIVKTVSIANSDVADVVVAGPREVLINGIDIGRTTLVIWDETHRSMLFDVVVRGPYSDQQIEIRVKIAEVNRTRAFELGFDYLFSFEQDNGAEWAGGLFGGSVSTPASPLPFFGGSGVEGLTGALKYVKGTTTLATAIHALVSNGVLHVLAEPNVVAASGQEASFLSGGEIPVPVASAGATGGATVTIEWKEFGVKVLFIPTIVDSGVISMYIAPEVSSLDYANAVEVSGFRIPALRTRKAQTTVELKDQETLVIGGLFLEEETRVRTRVPILGHIPLLGYLFSDTRNVKTVSELILVISPRIIHAEPPGVVVPLPEISDRGDKDKTKD
ncbi:MAG: pilus assembly protein N-terminal domain-containing protein [Candidatus Krumholzibacteriota bacterium]|nr:pilus assembly protein N-terminal domain-containing protein [Candidatus Krumholzibacteriota bacterium]